MLERWALRRVLRDPAKTVLIGHHSISKGGSRHGIHNLAIKKRTSRVQQTTTRLNLRPISRSLITASIPSVLVPPLIFLGLLLSLWAWKCFWIIVLQDRLLYISWLPPFARSDKITDYEAECKPVRWEEKYIRSSDGTKLAICEGHFPARHHHPKKLVDENNVHRNVHSKRKLVVICYFQGNGGSTPMRLPLLSQVLRSITDTSMTRPDSSTPSADERTEYIILTLSYRGYWTSSGRASQSGIEMDAQAFLDWVSATYATPSTDLQIILWGHSLGSAIASTAAATYLGRHYPPNNTAAYPPSPPPASIAGLILEAPTSTIKDMLISLYPQKWLPYRYLWPFSWNTWNIGAAMDRIADWRDQIKEHGTPPPILLLSAQNDEVIPSYVPVNLQRKGKDLRLQIEWMDVPRALHTEAPIKMEGKIALVDFIHRNTSCAGYN